MGSGLSTEQKNITLCYIKKEAASPRIHKPQDPLLISTNLLLPNDNSNPQEEEQHQEENHEEDIHNINQHSRNQSTNAQWMSVQPSSWAFYNRNKSSVAPEGMALENRLLSHTNNGVLNEDKTCYEYNKEGDLIVVPEEFVEPLTAGSLVSLESIGLCSQGLLKLSRNIGFLQQTTLLQLCCNDLTSLPLEIGYMSNLKYLSIAKNKISSLPDTIGCLKKLIEIKLSQNRLTNLPYSIRYLKNLRLLYADHNLLKELPSELGQLDKLMVLDVSYNPISSLPAELISLKDIRRMKAESCPMTTLFPSKVYKVPSLKELAARCIVRHRIPILNSLPPHTKDYLASAHECSFCHGPYFESYVSRYRWLEKNDTRLQFEYRLCCSHWNSEKERVAVMFQPMPETSPDPINKKTFMPIPTVANDKNVKDKQSSIIERRGRRRGNSVFQPLKLSTRSQHSRVESDDAINVPLTSLPRSPSLPNLPKVLKNSSSTLSLIKRSIKPSKSTFF